MSVTILQLRQHSFLYYTISFLLLLSYFIRFYEELIPYGSPEVDLNLWSYSEYLINYQGGFVRRGLLGELLFSLRQNVDFDLHLSIFIFCIVMYITITVFFIIRLKKEGYSWWIVMSPMFINMPYFFIRKDFLMYGIFILVLYCLSKNPANLGRRIGSCLLICTALFIHEPIFFWGVPVYILLICAYPSKRIVNYILAALPVCVFFILVLARGSEEIARQINDSWNTILPGSPMIYETDNSIGALGWNAFDTFAFHWQFNRWANASGRLFIPLQGFGAYYLFSNFLFVFLKSNLSQREIAKKRLAISTLYASSCITLIPMFTVLSCDIPRIYQYAAIATFAPFLIIPTDRILAIYPDWYKNMILRCNKWIDRMLPPGKGWMIFLLFFLDSGAWYVHFPDTWTGCNTGTLFNFLLDIRRML